MKVSKDDPGRQARLAEALRVNLRRRKAQARDRDEGAPTDRPHAGHQRPDDAS
jgi:hypothetical protein